MPQTSLAGIPSNTSRRAMVAGGAGLAAALLGAAFMGTARAQDATPGASAGAALPPFPPDEQLALDQIVADRVGGQQVPGAVAGVAIPGRGTWL